MPFILMLTHSDCTHRPEVNQRISKAAHIKELNTEIDKLKEELFATREKNGIYLPADHWESQQVRNDKQHCVHGQAQCASVMPILQLMLVVMQSSRCQADCLKLQNAVVTPCMHSVLNCAVKFWVSA